MQLAWPQATEQSALKWCVCSTHGTIGVTIHTEHVCEDTPNSVICTEIAYAMQINRNYYRHSPSISFNRHISWNFIPSEKYYTIEEKVHYE